jgi:hypothetical protein
MEDRDSPHAEGRCGENCNDTDIITPRITIAVSI